MAEREIVRFREGFRAHMRGTEPAENPYPVGSLDHAQWVAGWLDREDHQSAKAECLPGW
jgi:hypothetical protein